MSGPYIDPNDGHLGALLGGGVSAEEIAREIVDPLRVREGAPIVDLYALPGVRQHTEAATLTTPGGPLSETALRIWFDPFAWAFDRPGQEEPAAN